MLEEPADRSCRRWHHDLDHAKDGADPSAVLGDPNPNGRGRAVLPRYRR